MTERGYPVAEVLQRLGVSQHPLYAWKKKFSRPSGGDDKDTEIRRLKRDLVRVTEERDILKTTAYLTCGHFVPPEMPSEMCFHCRASR